MSHRLVCWIGVPVLAVLCSTALAQEKKEPAKEPAKNGKDVVAVAEANKLATFVELVKEAGLLDTLKGPGPLTVFVPTDAAFKKMGDLEALKKDKAKLANLLKGHVVKGKVDLKTEKTLKPLAGPDIVVTTKDGKMMLNGMAAVGKEFVASNGVIYEVDQVLATAALPTPPTPKPPADKPAPKPAEPKK